MKNLSSQLARVAFCGVIALGTETTSFGNLVSNGGFESSGGNGQVGFNTSLTDWSVPAPPGSYTFVFAPGTADTTGANGQYGNVGLWGPGNGVANGLPAASPAGGNFVAQDGTFQQGALSQIINGLTPGAHYTVGFWWGGEQQSGFLGANTEQWQVSLGSQSQFTPVVHNPSQGFSGWMHQTFTFTADSTSDVLSFLASGSPSGVPPLSLLDGVTMTPASAPDSAPTALLLGVAGVAMVAAARLRRRLAPVRT